nr:WbqC family protein [Butyrivibrio sp.]
MQPYFFPYIGYFSLIEYSDRFIFFDTPQYISHGWVNRNRILSQQSEPTYITVPIKKAPQETAIKDIFIDNSNKWKEKIYGQLSVYKRKAPNYKDVNELIHEILDCREWNNLSELNVYSTQRISQEIGIDSKYDVFSEMHLEIDTVKSPDEWALYITKALGGDIYVNPPGGKSFFNKKKYEDMNIELVFLESNLPSYIQRIGKWVPGLSIIDVMMYCGKDEIKGMVKDFSLSH